MSHYNLVRIIDGKSSMKSEIARNIIEEEMYKYNIEYLECSKDDRVNCQNNIYHIVNNVLKVRNPVNDVKKNVCKKSICDKFIIENTITGEEKIIGNNCISTLIRAKIILNMDIDNFKHIEKKLKCNEFCFLCNSGSNKGYHSKCINGKGGQYKVLKKQVINHLFMIFEIKREYLYNKVKFFKNHYFINHITRDIYNKKILTALEDFIVSNQLIIDNQDKLLQLKNNCIVKSIIKQTRSPSIKQMIMIEKILNDFPRVLKLDNENDNDLYKKYGYLYPRKNL